MVKRVFLSAFLVAVTLSFANAEPPSQFSIPAGTMLHCRTNQTVTTALNKQGDSFSINVSEPVMINGQVAIPAGSMIYGRILYLKRPGRIAGVGEMRLNLDQMTLPDGRSFPLAATLIDAYGPNHVKVVGNEGVVKGPNSHFGDFEEIGGGGAGGALLGLMFGHPIVGATVGLTAGTVDRLRRRGKELTIPVGTQLNYQLNRELAINREAPRTTASNQIRNNAE